MKGLSLSALSNLQEDAEATMDVSFVHAMNIHLEVRWSIFRYTTKVNRVESSKKFGAVILLKTPLPRHLTVVKI